MPDKEEFFTTSSLICCHKNERHLKNVATEAAAAVCRKVLKDNVNCMGENSVYEVTNKLRPEELTHHVRRIWRGSSLQETLYYVEVPHKCSHMEWS